MAFTGTWKSTITSHIRDVAFDFVTPQRQTQSKMAGALVVNILVFDLRVQLQHCTYQRKTLLFSLIEVSTFICKREISGLSSPLTLNYKFYPDVMPREMSCPVETMNSFLLTFINHQVLHGKQLTS